MDRRIEDNAIRFETMIIKQIVNKDDENTKEVIRKYAAEYSKEKGIDVQVMFLDEDIVKRIIDLGIAEYMRLYR